ncbi:uncharacterized protein HHUB_3488 [Halobacterium hubeiense]|uniref:Lipoprotein n=1 Tax=Halobacterium hubeiense TaxID=1407499 RepID=A0A0U5AIF8_9EURY|nr:hypothetical protein [Halobacterium hubeiense]CQH61576.1 uncharacterized protein HHUB_3488 [Halobacterium hubeiense]
MRRRTVLAAVAALAAGSGCSRVVGDDPVEVRVRRAGEAAVENADVYCPLSATFLEAHPALERVLSSATTAPDGEWVVTDVDRETGEALRADLRERCGQVGAVYRYDGDEYRVRVLVDGHTVQNRNSSASSEAIRRGRPQERT